MGQFKYYNCENPSFNSSSKCGDFNTDFCFQLVISSNGEYSFFKTARSIEASGILTASKTSIEFCDPRDDCYTNSYTLSNSTIVLSSMDLDRPGCMDTSTYSI